MAPTLVPDPVDAAIAAAERPSAMVSLELKLSSGRAIGLIVPVDMGSNEAVELIGAIARDLPGAIVQAVQQQRGSGLVVPDHGLVLPRA